MILVVVTLCICLIDSKTFGNRILKDKKDIAPITGDASDIGLLTVMVHHVDERMKKLETLVENSITRKGKAYQNLKPSIEPDKLPFVVISFLTGSKVRQVL